MLGFHLPNYIRGSWILPSHSISVGGPNLNRVWSCGETRLLDLQVQALVGNISNTNKLRLRSTSCIIKYTQSRAPAPTESSPSMMQLRLSRNVLECCLTTVHQRQSSKETTLSNIESKDILDSFSICYFTIVWQHVLLPVMFSPSENICVTALYEKNP